MQPEVGLAGPGALVLGTREVLVVLCPPTGSAQVSVVRVGVAVHQIVEGRQGRRRCWRGQVARREHRL